MKITKRNGNITMYDDQKIVRSILKANAETQEETINENIATAIADDVFGRLTEESEIITTKDIKDCVVKILRERGYPETARLYLEYK